MNFLKFNNPIRPLIFLVFILLYFQLIKLHAQVGMSCPPCTNENSQLEQQQDRLNRLQSDLQRAQQELRNRLADQALAQSAVTVANRLVRRTCMRLPPNPYACSAALVALAVAQSRLNYTRILVQETQSEIAGINSEIQSANMSIQHWKRELSKCQARGRNLGNCKECSGGTIRNKNNGTSIPGKKCKECQNGSEANKPNGSAIDGEECKECRGGREVNKRNGTAVAGEDCKECQNGQVANKPDNTSCLGWRECCSGTCTSTYYTWDEEKKVSTCNNGEYTEGTWQNEGSQGMTSSSPPAAYESSGSITVHQDGSGGCSGDSEKVEIRRTNIKKDTCNGGG